MLLCLRGCYLYTGCGVSGYTCARGQVRTSRLRTQLLRRYACTHTHTHTHTHTTTGLLDRAQRTMRAFTYHVGPCVAMCECACVCMLTHACVYICVYTCVPYTHAALAEEPPGLRATVAEATASLAAAFQLPTHANTNNLTTDTHMADAGSTGSGGVSVGVSWQGELDSLLLSSVTSNRDAVRMCAVQWANRIYPTRHAPVSPNMCALW